MNAMSPNRAATSVWSAPVPAFFNAKNAAKWGYRPDIVAISKEAHDWRSRKAVSPAASDGKKVQLLLIDVQQDFCLPEGALYVGGRSGKGAIEDSARIAEFIYRNLGDITQVSATLDTHFLFQIFFPSFWEKADGTPVEPHTMIKVADLDAGTYRVSPQAAAAVSIPYMWLTQYARHYCESLERSGKYVLYIWPYHCLLGTDGHALVGVVEEACSFHGFARGSQFHLEVKGGNFITENYSVLSPEVLLDQAGKPRAQKNTRFIETLLKADRVIIAGQAASHCVKSTIADLLTEIVAKDPALARKVYIMEDCMSAVAVPDGKGGFVADFTAEAEAALKQFADAGMHVVSSTTPIGQWADF